MNAEKSNIFIIALQLTHVCSILNYQDMCC